MSQNNNQNEELNQENQEKKINIEKHRHGLYYVIPSQIMDTELLLPNEKLLYGILSGLANQKGKCFPSDEYLAKRLNVHYKTIGDYLKNFENLKLIKRNTKRIYGQKPQRTIQLIFTDFTEFETDNNIPPEADNGIPPEAESITILESEDILESEEYNRSPSEPNGSLASDDAHFCSNYLFKKLKEIRNDRKEPNWKIWNNDFEKMMRIDKRSKEKIIEAIDFVMRDDNKFKVESPASLREKYENIADHIVLQNKKNTFQNFTKDAIPIITLEDKKINSVASIINNWIMYITKDPCKVGLGTIKIEEKRIIGPGGQYYKKSLDILMDIAKNVYKVPDLLLAEINKKCYQIENISKLYQQKIL